MHLEVIEKVIAYAGSIWYEVKNLEFSPIKGPEGNIEYLLHIQKQAEGYVQETFPVDPAKTVEEAHSTLD